MINFYYDTEKLIEEIKGLMAKTTLCFRHQAVTKIFL